MVYLICVRTSKFIFICKKQIINCNGLPEIILLRDGCKNKMPKQIMMSTNHMIVAINTTVLYMI